MKRKNNIRALPILPQTIILSLLFTIASAQLPLPEQRPILPDVPVIDPRAPGAGPWEIMPHSSRFGGVPSPSLTVGFTEPVTHNPQSILEVRVQSPEPLILLPTAITTSGQLEVLSAKEVQPGGDSVARWAFDDRLGYPHNIVGISLSALQNEEPTSVTINAIHIVSASILTDDELLEASYYKGLSLKFHQVHPVDKDQDAVVVIPMELAQRYRDARLVLTINGEEVAREFLGTSESDRQVFVRRLSVPLSEVQEQQVVEARIVDADNSSLLIGREFFGRLPDEFTARQFEVAHQSIHDYVPFYWPPDLGLMTVVKDLYSKDEPRELTTTTRDVIAHAVSISTGNYESQVTMRAPAFGNWAAAGFHSVAVGTIESNYAFYITGTSPEGVDFIGLASTAGKAPVKPFFTNPVFHPAPELVNWREGMTRTIRGNTIAPYLRSYIMLNTMQAEYGEPRTVASLSPDLRVFADAGPMPMQDQLAGPHLDLTKYDSEYILLTNAHDRIFASTDPLREWQTRRVNFPSDWRQMRLVQLNEQWFLFGLVDIYGRNVLRYTEIDWQDGIPLPRTRPQTRGTETNNGR